ncbi:MAG TPA: gamma-glutamyltransferase family protein [Ramlibacter sp.]|nr:gamma-glutamyltransferase family protein [Ramlibacter sp.]
MRRFLGLVAATATLVLAGCAPLRATAPPGTSAEMPEAASGYATRAPARASRHMVAAANGDAARTGLAILREGGSAVDAAIAMQMVLALVEPQSSGLGGGAFLIHHDGRAVQAYDGRETAPAAATPGLFLRGDGTPLAFDEAVATGRAVGVPGVLRMLELAHGRHGRLPWARLFEPAIALAESGFTIGPRLHQLLAQDRHLRRDAQAASYFYGTDGRPHPVGHVLRNPALAQLLRRLAREGSAALYAGSAARSIVAKVGGHPTHPGGMTPADLASYQPRVREPLCFAQDLRGRRLRICGMPPPSSGTLAVGQILGLLQRTGATAEAPPDGLPTADWLHLFTEASRLAFADRAQYVADPDFVQAPAGRWSSLLDGTYLDRRAALVAAGPSGRSMGQATPGQPDGAPLAQASMPAQPESGTTHLSVVDGHGNALAMTSTVESAFGSRLMSDGGTGLPGGFLLNNQLTDFSFAPQGADGLPVANRVQPGKRPRSSMAPLLVLDAGTGQFVMAIGSAGGPFIIHDVARSLVGVLYWGLHPQQALELPLAASLNGPTLLEQGRFPAATLAALRARGHEVRELALPLGGHSVVRSDAALLGGADPRREGLALGD